MKNKIIMGVILSLIIVASSIYGYKSYSKNKWVKDNWNSDYALSNTDDFDAIKALIEYRDSVGAVTTESMLNDALATHLGSGRYEDSRQKFEIAELLISKGANPNYCDKDGCIITDFLKYRSNKFRDSLKIFKLFMSKGVALQPTPQNSVKGIDDCTFDGAEASDEIFDYIFNDYLKNKLTNEILECSAKNIVLSSGTNDDVVLKKLNRLSWLVRNGLNPNVEVYGFIIINSAEGNGKFPILYHLLWRHHLYKENPSLKEKSYLLVKELLDKGADVKEKFPDLSLVKLAEKSGDVGLFQLINSRFK